jgi:hypothetical protein
MAGMVPIAVDTLQARQIRSRDASATPLAVTLVALCGLHFVTVAPHAQQPATPPTLLAEPVHVSRDFRDCANNYYVADTVVQFDPATASGTLKWLRNNRYPRLAFN